MGEVPGFQEGRGRMVCMAWYGRGLEGGARGCRGLNYIWQSHDHAQSGPFKIPISDRFVYLNVPLLFILF